MSDNNWFQELVAESSEKMAKQHDEPKADPSEPTAETPSDLPAKSSVLKALFAKPAEQKEITEEVISEKTEAAPSGASKGHAAAKEKRKKKKEAEPASESGIIL